MFEETTKLTLAAAICGGGSCPSVYRTNRNTVVIQGRAVTASESDIDLADDEALVEIPEDLLIRLTQLLGADGGTTSSPPRPNP